MSRHPIGIAGTGAVARALGRALHEAGITVGAIAGRDSGRTEAAARFIAPSVRATTVVDLSQHARHILIATEDSNLDRVAQILAGSGHFGDRLALSTSGTRGAGPLAPLAREGAHIGMFHPLQTVADPDRTATSFAGVTFGTNGDASAVRIAGEWAFALRAEVVHIDPDRLASYHAAAVLASNAIAALVDAASELMAAAGVGGPEARRAIAPLARTALDNALTHDPVTIVTGPVIRGDVAAVGAHVRALEDLPPALGALYRGVSEQLLSMAARRGLESEKRTAVAAILRAGRDSGVTR